MKTIRIFLASSSELKTQREQFELFLGRRNKSYKRKGLFLELINWEDFMDSVSNTRLQDEYNKAISSCDIFVMLYYSKVGKYTEEEFDFALSTFKDKGRPKIYVYFDTSPPPENQSDRHKDSLKAFNDKLRSIGHFKTEYPNTDRLKLHFFEQLDRLEEEGFFEPEQAIKPTPSIFEEIREKMPFSKSLVQLLEEYEDRLLEIAPGESNSLILFKARFNQLEQNKLLGIISESGANLQKNQLNNVFLNLLDNFERQANLNQ